jgi:hypothetical protein
MPGETGTRCSIASDARLCQGQAPSLRKLRDILASSACRFDMTGVRCILLPMDVGFRPALTEARRTMSTKARNPRRSQYEGGPQVNQRALRGRTAIVSTFLFLVVLASPAFMFAQVGPPTNTQEYALQIELEGTTGSGFLASDSLRFYFVTARHVLFKDTLARVLIAEKATISGYDVDRPYAITLNLAALRRDGRIRADTVHDVAVIWMGDKLTPKETTQVTTDRRYITRNSKDKTAYNSASLVQLRRFDQVRVGSDVYVFGYPTSIGLKRDPQLDYDRPLVQKGIVAGLNPEKKTIVLNAAAYAGNSGGPVVEVEYAGNSAKFVPIGVVTEYIPFEEQQINVSRRWYYSTITSSPYSIAEPLDPVIDIMKRWR